MAAAAIGTTIIILLLLPLEHLDLDMVLLPSPATAITKDPLCNNSNLTPTSSKVNKATATKDKHFNNSNNNSKIIKVFTTISSKAKQYTDMADHFSSNSNSTTKPPHA